MSPKTKTLSNWDLTALRVHGILTALVLTMVLATVTWQIVVLVLGKMARLAAAVNAR